MIRKIRLFVLLHFAIQFISRPIIKQRNAIRDSVLQHAGSRRSLVLDFGCGEGIFSDIFRDETNIAYVEVDKSIDFLRFSKSNNKNNSCILSNEKLCFKNCAFDFVILNNVLHHMTYDEISRLLSEVSRTLKGTGFIIIMEMVPLNQQKGIHCKIITFIERKLKKINYFQINILDRFLNQFTLIEEKRVGDNFIHYVFMHRSENKLLMTNNN